MSRRLPVTPAPAPLEADSQHCDPRFAKRHQRDVLRRYLAGLRLPTERNTTRTARANTDPVRGAQHPRAQARQWFLAESPWSPERGTTQRRPLLRAAP